MKNKIYISGSVLVAVLMGALVFWLVMKDQSQANRSINEQMMNNGTEIAMYKALGCLCCDNWNDYLGDYGFETSVHKSNNMTVFKNEKNIPFDMRSCHTAIVEGYIVEGHVPVEDINRLLKERPDIVGIAAPGMPAASPGMDASSHEPYDVYQFDMEGNIELFASH